MSKESGDGKPNPEEVLRKLKKATQLEESRGKGNETQKKKKKTGCCGGRSGMYRCLRCPLQTTYLPQPLLHRYPIPPKTPQSQCLPPHLSYVAPYPSSPLQRKNRPNSIKHRKNLKAGTTITNVTHALEDFKKRRDKFLTYLTQLQHELNSISLPSASKEKLDVRNQKDACKKKRKVHKPPQIKKKIDTAIFEVPVSRTSKVSVGKGDIGGRKTKTKRAPSPVSSSNEKNATNA